MVMPVMQSAAVIGGAVGSKRKPTRLPTASTPTLAAALAASARRMPPTLRKARRSAEKERVLVHGLKWAYALHAPARKPSQTRLSCSVRLELLLVRASR